MPPNPPGCQNAPGASNVPRSSALSGDGSATTTSQTFPVVHLESHRRADATVSSGGVAEVRVLAVAEPMTDRQALIAAAGGRPGHGYGNRCKIVWGLAVARIRARTIGPGLPSFPIASMVISPASVRGIRVIRVLVPR